MSTAAQVGQAFLDMGVISAGDMTMEACVTKLAYLLGRGLRGDELRVPMMTDLRGELSAQSGLTSLTQMKRHRASKL